MWETRVQPRTACHMDKGQGQGENISSHFERIWGGLRVSYETEKEASEFLRDPELLILSPLSSGTNSYTIWGYFGDTEPESPVHVKELLVTTIQPLNWTAYTEIKRSSGIGLTFFFL